MKTSFAALSALLGCASVCAFAQVPTRYDLQLLANTGSTGFPAFNLPSNASISSASPDLNNLGFVTFRVDTSGIQNIWYGRAGSGGLVLSSADDNPLFNDARLNDNGLIVFTDSFNDYPGVTFIDTNNGNASGQYAQGPGTNTSYSTVRLNNAGQVAFKGKSGGVDSYISYDKTSNSFATHVSQTAPYTFLYSGITFNNNRQIAAKVDLATGGSAIYIFNADQTTQLIARDQNADPTSPYRSFSNSIGFNDNGQVAFIANLVGGGYGVYLSNGTNTVTIATSAANSSDITATVQSFAPAVNNKGQVAFRANAVVGGIAIYMGDGTRFEKVVGDYDEITDSNGNTVLVRGTSGFGTIANSIDINEAGQVAFIGNLADPTTPSKRLGFGVIVATPPIPGDVDGNGCVDDFDLFAMTQDFLSTPGSVSGNPNTDLNGDGTVDDFDLFTLTQNFLEGC